VSQPLVLSLFPGIGLLDMAFELEGFCVVRGPDVLWGGDIKRFHPPSGVFDGVIGGPPCKAFSRLVHMVRANGYEVAENLIPEFSRCVYEAQPRWFLMENVDAAPPPLVPGYRTTSCLFNNRWAPEAPAQNRLRRLFFGGPLPGIQELEFEVCAFENGKWEPVVSSHAEPTPVRMAHYASGVIAVKPRDLMKRRTVAEMCELQGLPPDYLDEAPFTESGKRAVIGNGVPLPMGRAIARAVKRAMGYESETAA
jgi:DNA (cytosine-5)-methyltransferase 1